MKNNTEFRAHVIESINILIQMRYEIFEDVRELTATDESRETGSASRRHEILESKLAYLKSVSGERISGLFEVIDAMQHAVDSLMRANNISNDDVHWENMAALDDPDHEYNVADRIFDWIITYEDGILEPFQGTPHEVYGYASRTGKAFGVESIDVSRHNQSPGDN